MPFEYILYQKHGAVYPLKITNLSNLQNPLDNSSKTTTATYVTYHPYPQQLPVHQTAIMLTMHTLQMNGSVKEPNKFHNYETEKITRKASDTVEYIELFGSSTRDHHAWRI